MSIQGPAVEGVRASQWLCKQLAQSTHKWVGIDAILPGQLAHPLAGRKHCTLERFQLTPPAESVQLKSCLYGAGRARMVASPRARTASTSSGGLSAALPTSQSTTTAHTICTGYTSARVRLYGSLTQTHLLARCCCSRASFCSLASRLPQPDPTLSVPIPTSSHLSPPSLDHASALRHRSEINNSSSDDDDDPRINLRIPSSAGTKDRRPFGPDLAPRCALRVAHPAPGNSSGQALVVDHITLCR